MQPTGFLSSRLLEHLAGEKPLKRLTSGFLPFTVAQGVRGHRLNCRDPVPGGPGSEHVIKGSGLAPSGCAQHWVDAAPARCTATSGELKRQTKLVISAVLFISSELALDPLIKENQVQTPVTSSRLQFKVLSEMN